jgi:hypothetical protein
MMVDSRIKMLEQLALTDPDDDARKPYNPRAAQELAEAHETQQRIDAMDDDTPEDGIAEEHSEEPEDGEAYLREQVRRLRASNIELQAKLVAAQSELSDLRTTIATLRKQYSKMFGGE